MIPRIQNGTLEFVRSSRLYAARCSARPAFAAYATLDALLSALFGQDKVDPASRCHLICAVIAEHQAAPSPLWPAVVLHAFRGMLVRLSKSLVGVDDRDEADALVVAGLFEAMRRVRPARDPVRIGMYVRQETRRAVFQALRRDARTRQYQQVDEDVLEEREEPDEEEPSRDDEGDDASCEEPPRDPLAYERAMQRRAPDALADPESLSPLEERLLLLRPSVDAIPDETLLRAHAVRGGLRRLANLLFEDASPRERETLYRQIVRRTRGLLATPT